MLMRARWVDLFKEVWMKTSTVVLLQGDEYNHPMIELFFVAVGKFVVRPLRQGRHVATSFMMHPQFQVAAHAVNKGIEWGSDQTPCKAGSVADESAVIPSIESMATREGVHFFVLKFPDPADGQFWLHDHFGIPYDPDHFYLEGMGEKLVFENGVLVPGLCQTIERSSQLAAIFDATAATIDEAQRLGETFVGLHCM